jgi:hypothetical protein
MTMCAAELPRIESSWRSVGPAGAIHIFGLSIRKPPAGLNARGNDENGRESNGQVNKCRGQATPGRKGIDLILHAATVPARAFPTVRTIASEGVYPNGTVRRMGISIPLHLDRTATSNHRTGKYSTRLPEPVFEGENG